ncbi:MAG: TolC family protein [Candidatus Rokuibacteriota bacterium]
MRAVRRLCLAACLTIGASAGESAAQPVAPTPTAAALQLTLEEAISQALTRNRDLRVSRRDVDVSRGKLQQAERYPFNPELSVEGEGGRAVGREDTEFRGIGGGKIGLSQVIEIRGQRGLRVLGAEADVRRAEWGSREAERDVIADVTKAFSDVLVAQERIALARESLTLAENLRNAAKTLVDAGDVPELDLLRADVEVRRAENRVRLDEASAMTATRTLALLIGAPADVGVTATGPLLLAPIPGSVADLLVPARASRPDLKAAEAATESAHAALRLVRADRFFPSVTVSAGYGEALDFDARTRMALVGVSIPLPFWNRREGDIKAAEAEVAKQQAERERIFARIDKEVITAYRQFAAAQQVVQGYLRQIVPAQGQNARLVEEGYRLGQLRLTEALLAQRDLIEARTAYLEAIANYNAARVDLQKAAGVRP